MTITLDLKPEVEAGLLELAQTRGLSVQEYLLSILEEVATHSATSSVSVPRLSQEEAVQRMLEFGEKHRLSLGEPITRDLLHEGHRF